MKILTNSNGQPLMSNGKAYKSEISANLKPKYITENGTYLPSADNADGYSSVSVDVQSGAVTMEYTPSSATALIGPGKYVGIDTIIQHATKATGVGKGFYSVEGVRKFVFDAPLCTSLGDFAYRYIDDYSLEEVEFRNIVKPITRFERAFYCRAGLKKITGYALDFSSSIYNTDAFYNCKSLEELEVANNTINKVLSFKQSPNLTNATIISIANGLNSTTTDTLTVHTDVFTKCGTIKGNVVDGNFMENASGTTTLSDFITSTKGWTLAK